ncbi:MAG TPA: VOC family protein [Ignavibacteria bacterium]|nr:VOC family protein [Ignavibacteria bacterium]HQY51311.1 VOC family protein [Ignavibacteria bacterium]
MNGVIHHIEIYVSDLNKSTAFWQWLLTEKFSYKVFQKWDSGISFKFESSYIVFVQTEKKYAANSYNRKNTGLNHLAFHCTSRNFVDDLTIDLKYRNIEILYPEKHPYAGGENYYAVFFEDPDRIKVEVVVSEN